MVRAVLLLLLLLLLVVLVLVVVMDAGFCVSSPPLYHTTPRLVQLYKCRL